MTDNGKAQEVVKHIQAALTEMWEAEKLLNEMGVETCDNLYMRGSGDKQPCSDIRGHRHTCRRARQRNLR